MQGWAIPQDNRMVHQYYTKTTEKITRDKIFFFRWPPGLCMITGNRHEYIDCSAFVTPRTCI